MNKILLIGSIPPPIGGVTIHLDRFLNLYSKGEFELGVLDIKKRCLYKKGSKYKNIFQIFNFFLSSKIVHIHISNDYIKLFCAIVSKLFLKKVIYTHHNSIVKNKILFKFMYFISDKVILVNDKEMDKNLIIDNKTLIIPAFLPPYKFNDLPYYLDKELSRFQNIISTNCFSYNLINGKHVYGFDLVIEAFYKLSKEGKIKNTLLVLVDPSNTTKAFINNLLDGLHFGTNKVLLINEKIDFVSLLKKSSLTIRATRTDGDSISVRESLYFNIPVVASDVAVRPKGTIIFKNEDSNDLANKIMYALNNKHKIIYNHIDYGQEIINLYKNILKGD